MTSKTVFGVTLLWLAAASAVGAQGMHTVDAGGGLYIQQVFGQALIREPSGEVTELPLPFGATVRRLVPLEGGWLAAGEVETLGTTELFLLGSQNGTRTFWPTPPNATGQPLRINPVPLVQSGQLVAVAWIEGPRVRQSAVYAATWSGSDWSSAELVSPPGPGTQIGLDGAVLPDGSWMLTWSAYDGADDEIVWSRRRVERWSPVRPLHAPNEHPDIVPSLLPTGRGALAAWSSSDGKTYTARLARFEGGAWRELPLVAPRGSVRPTLTPEGDGALLLYRTVVPPTWVVVELDIRGRTVRRAVSTEPTTFRPGLVPGADQAPTLEWPGVELAMPVQVDLQWESGE